MKRIFLFVASLFILMGVQAQPKPGTFSVTPKVGVNLAKLTKFSWVVDEAKPRYKSGFVGGVDVNYQATDISAISLGVFYSMQGVKITDFTVNNGDGTYIGVNDMHWDWHYINIPLMYNFYMAEGLAAKIGVQAEFLLSNKFKAVSTKFTEDEDGLRTYGPTQRSSSEWSNVHKFDLGIPVGLSYEYMNVVLDARYNLGLLRVIKEGFSSQNSFFTFTVGYKFDL